MEGLRELEEILKKTLDYLSRRKDGDNAQGPSALHNLLSQSIEQTAKTITHIPQHELCSTVWSNKWVGFECTKTNTTRTQPSRVDVVSLLLTAG